MNQPSTNLGETYAAYQTWKTQPLTGPPTVSVVIPAYNEAERIVPTIGAIAAYMSTLAMPWELIVADDGSTDETVALLQGLEMTNLRVLIAERNGGKGSAVRRGMQAARGEYVLFADADAGVIGAAHAGWRGAFDGVLEATVDAMEALGARRDEISAVVGPTISQRNYEVGQDFLERFMDEDPDHGRFFTHGTREGKYRFDLPSFVLWRLRGAGVGSATWIRACTYAEPDRFFSFRRTTHLGEPDYGRLISAITL